MNKSLLFVIPFGLIVIGCGGDSVQSGSESGKATKVIPVATPDLLPVFDDPVMQTGRAIWIQKCGKCHFRGKAGSPKTLDKEEWKNRIATKGRDTLLKHTIHGFETLSTEMPARGGFEELTDAELIAAVDYIIKISTN
ncbi:MAG: c-type cytochrome [Verrucomicrobiota bacterium]